MSPADLDNPDEVAFYNRTLIDLSATVGDARVLEGATHQATARSPICGSVVTVHLTLDADQRVTGFGYELEACALTRAVIAVMQNAVIGADRAEIAAAHTALAALLEGDAVHWPQEKWAGLSILAPLKDHRARHNAMQLPFEAAEKALS